MAGGCLAPSPWLCLCPGSSGDNGTQCLAAGGCSPCLSLRSLSCWGLFTGNLWRWRCLQHRIAGTSRFRSARHSDGQKLPHFPFPSWPSSGRPRCLTRDPPMGPTHPERGTKLGEGTRPRAEPGHAQCTNGPAAGGLGEPRPCEHPHASLLALALSWGGFPYCWHQPQLPCQPERAGAHPHPYGTSGVGIIPNPCQHWERETPLGGAVLGAVGPPQPSPSLRLVVFVTPEVSPCSGFVRELSVQLGCCPATKPCAAPLRPPGTSHTIVPPLPPAAATSFPAGTKSSSFHPNRGCAGEEDGTHLHGGLGLPYWSAGRLRLSAIGHLWSSVLSYGTFGDTLGSQLSPLGHLEGTWRSYLLPMGHLSGIGESQDSPTGHLGGLVLSYGATGGHCRTWFIPIGPIGGPRSPLWGTWEPISPGGMDGIHSPRHSLQGDNRAGGGQRPWWSPCGDTMLGGTHLKAGVASPRGGVRTGTTLGTSKDKSPTGSRCNTGCSGDAEWDPRGGTGGFSCSNWCSYTVTRTVTCLVQNGTSLQRVFQGCRWPPGCGGGR